MREKENPAPPTGGNRAGSECVRQRSFIRPIPRTQAHLAHAHDSAKRAIRQETERRLRLQRDVRGLRILGIRAEAEFIIEMAEHFGPYVDVRLAEYVRRLSREALYVARGDRLPPLPPLRAVERAR